MSFYKLACAFVLAGSAVCYHFIQLDAANIAQDSLLSGDYNTQIDGQEEQDGQNRDFIYLNFEDREYVLNGAANPIPFRSSDVTDSDGIEVVREGVIRLTRGNCFITTTILRIEGTPGPQTLRVTTSPNSDFSDPVTHHDMTTSGSRTITGNLSIGVGRQQYLKISNAKQDGNLPLTARGVTLSINTR